MGGAISGAALPQLADLVTARAMALPYAGTLWLGPRYGAYVLVWMLLWHFSIFVTSDGLSDFNKAQGYFTDIEFSGGTALFYGYYIVLPVFAAAFALLGALHHVLLRLPPHLLPFGHLFETRATHRLDDTTTRVKLSYALSMFIAALLLIVAAWLPTELLVAFLGGGEIAVAVVGSVALPAATLLFPLLPLLLCSGRSHVWATPARPRSDLRCAPATLLYVKLLVPAIVVAVPTTLVAYFMRDFEWTWMTAAIVWLTLVVFAGVMSACCSDDDDDDDDDDDAEVAPRRGKSKQNQPMGMPLAQEPTPPPPTTKTMRQAAPLLGMPSIGTLRV